MDWQEVIVTITEEAIEAVSNIMEEAGSGGVVIEDPAVIKRHIESAGWDAYELPGEILAMKNVKIKAYYPIDEKLTGRLEEIRLRLDQLNRELIPGSVTAIEHCRLAEEDWAHAWKAYYRPVKVGSRIVIKPSWEDYQQEADDLVIELDPGMAFGTGTHATTAMCLRALEKTIKGGESVYDVGTGSGILSIAAAKLGAGHVTAIDLDSTAVRVATENVDLNGVADKVKVREGNLLDLAVDKVPLVIANIIASVIIVICPAVKRILTPGGTFIASGIIQDRWDEVRETLIKNGFNIKEVFCEKEWVTVIAEKGE